MAVLARLTNFSPGTLIQSAQVNAELNQILNLLGGTSTSKNIVVVYSHATDAPLALNQTGAGIIQEWKLSGSQKLRVNNSGQLESLVTTGTAPLVVASTTKATNLNADKLDDQEGSYYLDNANATGVLSGALGGTGVANTGKTVTLGGNLTTSGAFAVTFTLTNTTNVTVPTTGTLSTLAGSEALTNKTVNGLTITTTTGTLTLTNGKTLSVAKSLTLDGTDGTTITFQGTDTYVGRATTDTLTNKTLTSPRIGTAILDTNGNELFLLTATGSAINEFTYNNAATGAGPVFQASGGDSNIDCGIFAKGTGIVYINTTLHSSTGKVTTRAGNGATASTSSITLGGLYHRNFTTANNSSTGETDLMSKTIEANVLGEDGDYFEIYASGTYGSENENHSIRFYWNGTSPTTMNLNTSGNTGTWVVRVIVMRVSSSSARVSLETRGSSNGAGTMSQDFIRKQDIATTFTGTVVCKVTGQAGGSNRVSQDLFIFEKFSTQ